MNRPKALLESLSFGEGPRWRIGKLWFSDFCSHRVMTFNLAGKAETSLEVPQRSSGLARTANGGLKLASATVVPVPRAS